MKATIGEGGRLVIPAAYRKELGIKPGDEVLLTLEDGEIRVVSRREAVARAHNLLRRYIPKGRSLSGELIKERWEERIVDANAGLGVRPAVVEAIRKSRRSKATIPAEEVAKSLGLDW